MMKDVVEQLITAQQESDDRFMRLEEKRIKLEERHFQRKERERKEDREFNLRMMQILMHGLSPHPSQTYSPPSFPLTLHPQLPLHTLTPILKRITLNNSSIITFYVPM